MREHRHAENFWRHVLKGDKCWVWAGYKNPLGYGLVTRRFNGKIKSFYAHRIAWELTRGPVPDGLKVCHSCDNPSCVRPDHLFIGTQADNMHDMDRKGRRAQVDYSSITHCPKGHPYDARNTRLDGPKRTHRTCRACDRERGRYGVDR